ncbi:hypothetical protein DYB25_013971 [Aphanomyces astaci]|uniref:Uncharacterized protein n=1 Tax=Aphanomyces astaci TaxID=112090 RepID=A0A397BTT5_APHAT|nr:hypothetical protein DYB25_013971 [Aphanomyces astaci]
MSLLPSSVQPFVGTPLDILRSQAYTLWKMDFWSQATSHNISEFFSTKDYVPQGNGIDTLARCILSLLKSSSLISMLSI